jgi:hypothetical protein
MEIPAKLPEKRHNSHLSDEERLTSFKGTVFDKILTKVQEGIQNRFEAVRSISYQFDFLWTYLDAPEDFLADKCTNFSEVYSDVSREELLEELKTLQLIHRVNFGDSPLSPLSLLNQIVTMNFETPFPYVTISLRFFLTLPVTVASAERSFSKLKLFKNYLRSNMGQQRLVDLAIMGIETDLTRQIDFDVLLTSLPGKKLEEFLCS